MRKWRLRTSRKGVNPGRNARSANSAQDVNGAYNAVFNSVLKTGKRTSMIIDPPDGKIPPLSPEASSGKAAAAEAAAPAELAGGAAAADPNDNPGDHRAIAALPRSSDAVSSAEHRCLPRAR